MTVKLGIIMPIILVGLMIMVSKGSDQNRVNIIPKPTLIEPRSGKFNLNANTVILVKTENPELIDFARYLATWLYNATGHELKLVLDNDEQIAGSVILFSLIDDYLQNLGTEGYQLIVDSGQIMIQAARPSGIFYALQSLRQLLPAEMEGDEKTDTMRISIPCVSITDKPRFGWRGMLLDCGRHFIDKEIVKRYIDLLAYYKMNRLHWHLTEDQGWRIEIKKYPRLTEIGAWRTYEDGTRYGGYYTQEDIKEIIAYAAKRYITVVPEIELPGHSLAALASYPQFSCTGGPFNVETQWGVHKDVYCAGNDKTFIFLENVLTEVMDLFPSKYIHIGGDECPKERWQNCPKCQKRIKSETLNDEHELQSYFIGRIEKFLNHNQRQLIGWDEILEGGLTPGATVQSWRGMEGAIAAARAGHDAIVSPTSHAYFDSDVATTNLRQVYSFEPVPSDLDEKESHHIIGGECNVWTERITEDNIDQMVFPRLFAMSEVLWSPGEDKDYSEFLDRVRNHYSRLDNFNVGYGAESKPISIIADFDANRLIYKITLEAGEPELELFYSQDGSIPNKNSACYIKPFVINKNSDLKVLAFRNGERYGELEVCSFQLHKAAGKKVQLESEYSEKYTGGGKFGLTNGIRGTINFRDGYWQGFEGENFRAVMDLGLLTEISRISVGFMQNTNSWIFLPREVEYAVSENGTDFQVLTEMSHDISQKNPEALIKEFILETNLIEARYIRVRAENLGICPEWHPGAGGKTWLFIDEIIVE